MSPFYDSYPLITKFRESVHDDTEDNVETNSGDDNEEGYVVEKSYCRHTEHFRYYRHDLGARS